MTLFMVAEGLAASQLSALIAAVVPFVAAIAFFLISPLFVAKVAVRVSDQITKDAASTGVTDDEIPPPVKPSEIGRYIEYAADAVQIIPLTLLPMTGAVFAISARVPIMIALGYLVLAFLAAVAVESWILSQLAFKYVTRRVFKYSVVTVIGIASNLLGLAMIVIYSP